MRVLLQGAGLFLGLFVLFAFYGILVAVSLHLVEDKPTLSKIDLSFTLVDSYDYSPVVCGEVWVHEFWDDGPERVYAALGAQKIKVDDQGVADLSLEEGTYKISFHCNDDTYHGLDDQSEIRVTASEVVLNRGSERYFYSANTRDQVLLTGDSVPVRLVSKSGWLLP